MQMYANLIIVWRKYIKNISNQVGKIISYTYFFLILIIFCHDEDTHSCELHFFL